SVEHARPMVLIARAFFPCRRCNLSFVFYLELSISALVLAILRVSRDEGFPVSRQAPNARWLARTRHIALGWPSLVAGPSLMSCLLHASARCQSPAQSL